MRQNRAFLTAMPADLMEKYSQVEFEDLANIILTDNKNHAIA